MIGRKHHEPPPPLPVDVLTKADLDAFREEVKETIEKALAEGVDALMRKAAQIDASVAGWGNTLSKKVSGVEQHASDETAALLGEVSELAGTVSTLTAKVGNIEGKFKALSG